MIPWAPWPAWVAALGVAAALLCWPGRAHGAVVQRGTAGAAAASALVVDADALLVLLEMVAVQVRAGASPVPAWRAALEVLGAPAAGPVVDPVAWLQRAARAVPAAQAASAGWQLAERTGAPLADVLAGVVDTLREEAALAADVEAALAGPRATVRLLTVLPLGGLALGELIGAHPVRVLTTAGPGRACAVGGIVLLLLGRWWMRRLVRAVGAPL